MLGYVTDSNMKVPEMVELCSVCFCIEAIMQLSVFAAIIL